MILLEPTATNLTVIFNDEKTHNGVLQESILHKRLFLLCNDLLFCVEYGKIMLAAIPLSLLIVKNLKIWKLKHSLI